MVDLYILLSSLKKHQISHYLVKHLGHFYAGFFTFSISNVFSLSIQFRESKFTASAYFFLPFLRLQFCLCFKKEDVIILNLKNILLSCYLVLALKWKELILINVIRFFDTKILFSSFFLIAILYILFIIKLFIDWFINDLYMYVSFSSIGISLLYITHVSA